MLGRSLPMRTVLLQLFSLLLGASLASADESAFSVNGHFENGAATGHFDSWSADNPPATGAEDAAAPNGATTLKTSRFEEVRSHRKNRNPRDNFLRGKVDDALDEGIEGPVGNDLKHGMDAAQNIYEALKIRRDRIDSQSATDPAASPEEK